MNQKVVGEVLVELPVLVTIKLTQEEYDAWNAHYAAKGMNPGEFMAFAAWCAAQGRIGNEARKILKAKA
jgi:hypothetical protein